MSDSDALFVCLEELNIYWLVALRRSENVWREAQRVQTERMGWISCALSDSRVLIGQCKSTYLELFLVKSGLCIERLNRIQISKQYDWFSAKCGSESLVAMSYENSNEVRVYRLSDDQLEEIAHSRLNAPLMLLWNADRLLATEWHNGSHSATELEVRGTRLERRSQLIAPNKNINVDRWCAVDEGMVIKRHSALRVLVQLIYLSVLLMVKIDFGEFD